MATPAQRIEALRAELASARESVDGLSAELAKPVMPLAVSPAASADQSEQVRMLQMQVAGLARALDEARSSGRTAEREGRTANASAAATLSSELARRVQEQLLEIESLRESKARLSAERDRWRADARRFGGDKQGAKQQEESAREELKRVRGHLADAVKRAEIAEKEVKHLKRELEVEQRRQEHLRQHFMRKASG